MFRFLFYLAILGGVGYAALRIPIEGRTAVEHAREFLAKHPPPHLARRPEAPPKAAKAEPVRAKEPAKPARAEPPKTVRAEAPPKPAKAPPATAAPAAPVAASAPTKKAEPPRVAVVRQAHHERGGPSQSAPGESLSDREKKALEQLLQR